MLCCMLCLCCVNMAQIKCWRKNNYNVQWCRDGKKELCIESNERKNWIKKVLFLLYSNHFGIVGMFYKITSNETHKHTHTIRVFRTKSQYYNKLHIKWEYEKKRNKAKHQTHNFYLFYCALCIHNYNHTNIKQTQNTKKKHTDELNLKAANERRKAKQRKKEFPPNSLRGFFSLSFVRHYKYNIINAAIWIDVWMKVRSKAKI